MKKLFAKILGAMLGLTLIVGTGIAFVSSQANAIPVHAMSEKTITINANSISKPMTEYSSKATTWKQDGITFAATRTKKTEKRNSLYKPQYPDFIGRIDPSIAPVSAAVAMSSNDDKA